MKHSLLFQRYIQIAETLGNMFPNILEAVVHDFSDLDHSVIFIINGNISGRTVGDGASELGLRRFLEEENIPDTLVNYTSISVRGNKLKSSSIAIRNDKGKMTGAFCLNLDVSHFEHFYRFLQPLISAEVMPLVGDKELIPPVSVEEDVNQFISQYLLQRNLLFSQLSYRDKEEIVAQLFQRGYFKQRGAILAIAEVLKISRQSIYKYLKKGA